VVLETDAPARIVFNDHRRFGLMTLLPTDRLEGDKLFKDIGVEPCPKNSMPPTGPGARWQENAGQIRPAGSAGCGWAGNIYVCEALFRAGISPKTGGERQPRAHCALVAAIKTVLKQAITAAVRPCAIMPGHRRPWQFQNQFLVYGREGKPCKGTRESLQGTVKRIVQADVQLSIVPPARNNGSRTFETYEPSDGPSRLAHSLETVK